MWLIDCPQCGAKRKEVTFDIQISTVGSNQHGKTFRILCTHCDGVSRLTEREGKEDLIKVIRKGEIKSVWCNFDEIREY